MADAVVKLKVESQEFDNKLARATQQLQHMEKEVRRTGASFEFADKEELAFIQSLGQMETKTQSLRTKMREYTESILSLTEMYQRLSDTEKNSDFGRGLLSSIDQIKQRAAELKDNIGDLDEELKNMASDTQFTDGVNLMTSTIGSCAAAMTAWTADSKELEQVIRELAKITTTVKAVQDLTNAFQKQNMVLLKNPYVIVATAAAALAVAIGKVVKKTQELTPVQKALNEAQQKGRDNAAEEIARIDALNNILRDNTRSLEDRKSALNEIQSLVPEYHGALTDEGTLINDNTSAINKYVDGLQRAAIAQAAFDKMVELQKQKMNEQVKLQKAQAELEAARSMTAGRTAVVTGGAGAISGAAAAGLANAGAEAAAQASVNRIQKAIDQADEQIDALRKLMTASDIAPEGKTTSTTTKTTKTTTTSKTTKADTEIVKTATMLWEQYAAEIAETERLLAEFRAMAANIDLTDGQRDWARGMADAYEEQLEKMKGATEEAAEEIKTDIQDIKAEMEELPSAFDMFKDGVGSIGTMVGALDSLKTMGEDLASVFRGEMDAWDSFMTVLSTGVGIMETVISVIEAINVLTEISATLKQKNAIAAASEAAAVATGGATQIATNTAVAATAGTAAAANAAEGSTAAGKAVAGIPIVGPILAAAAIAAVLGTMIAAISSSKSAGKFADGGIVGGSSYSGDNLTASVNSGELILNRAQQNTIASQLQGGAANIRVQGLVRGHDILLAASNYAMSTGKMLYTTGGTGLPIIAG